MKSSLIGSVKSFKENLLDSRSKILIADDEVFNIEALKGMLKLLGLPEYTDRIVTCFNGEELVEKVRIALQEDDPWRYPLILTDCSMPLVDGYEATVRIRSLFKKKTKSELSHDESSDGTPSRK